MAATKYNSAQKAAILMLAFGEDIASEIFKDLNVAEAKEVAKAMNSMQAIHKEDVDEILLEFHNKLSDSKKMLFGGVQFANNVLNKAFKGTANESLINDLKSFESPLFPTLKRFQIDALSTYLQRELPQTIAIIVAHLDPSIMGRVLKTLPESLQNIVVLRVATLEAVLPEMLEEINDALLAELDNQQSTYAIDGLDKLAKMLTASDTITRETLLRDIAAKDPGLAEKLEAMLFVFEDLEKIPDSSLQLLIQTANRTTLLKALKGVSSSLLDKFCRNMSQDAGKILREDLEAIPKIRVSDVEKSQHEIIALAKELEASGKIVLEVNQEVYV